jgi:predicted transcriptional regulator
MRRKSIYKLGETELDVLNIVWELKEASVSDVRERILSYREVAYTTIMTVMKNLADKGLLSYVQQGNSYVYSAKRPAEDVRRTMLKDLLTNVFGDSPLALVQTLVKDESVSPEELEEIKATIRAIAEEDEKDD